MLRIYHPQNPNEIFEAWPASDLNQLPVSPRLFIRDNDLYLEHFQTQEPTKLEIGDYIVRREGDFRLLRLRGADFCKFRSVITEGKVSRYEELATPAA